MRLRKDEVEAMKLLIDAEYLSEEAYIHAVFNGVVSLLANRDSHAVGVDVGGYIHAYGPFYDIRAARKSVSTYAGRLAVRAFTTTLRSPVALEPKE